MRNRPTASGCWNVLAQGHLAMGNSHDGGAGLATTAASVGRCRATRGGSQYNPERRMDAEDDAGWRATAGRRWLPATVLRDELAAGQWQLAVAMVEDDGRQVALRGKG